MAHEMDVQTRYLEQEVSLVVEDSEIRLELIANQRFWRLAQSEVNPRALCGLSPDYAKTVNLGNYRNRAIGWWVNHWR